MTAALEARASTVEADDMGRCDTISRPLARSRAQPHWRYLIPSRHSAYELPQLPRVFPIIRKDRNWYPMEGGYLRGAFQVVSID